MSGNGFRNQGWTLAVNAVAAANPEANPKKDLQKCKGKLGTLKARYELYVFVKTFSSSGWDDHLKYATHTDEFVEEFCRVRGDKYEICFTTSCPWWDELDDLFTGAISKATGRNVKILGKRKSKQKQVTSLPATPTPSATSSAPPSTASSSRSPLDDVDMNTQPAHAHDPGMPPSPRNMTPPSPARVPPGEFDDELAQVRRYFKRGRTNSGNARRNAEAGSQIARSIDNLSAAVAQPIVTSEDPRYVDDVVRILQDKTLLPDNPRGRLYR
ncbi:Myb-DNA-bind-3 domain-containing protein, partial [Favolaschia claudopus]